MNNYMKVLRESCIIAAAAAIIGFGVNMFHPRGYVFVPRDGLTQNKFVFLSLSEAKLKFDSQIALFVDARTEEDFTRAHIFGAVNIPALPEQRFTEKLNAAAARFDEPVEIVVYCSEASCNMADDVAGKIAASGYTRNIYIFKSGFSAWESEKYPLDTK